ncbi:hypothetical protein AB6848_20830 [Serratia proteamaculans]|uniref:hypothetical protein n=1 Tax=Serratia proteamaculans TaxID=28151 RepID=UPI0039BDE3FD
MEKHTRINHDFGYFLNPEKYVPIANQNDESFAALKLGLILENYLSTYITNVRAAGTEGYIKDSRYFTPKLEICVALGLPVSIADAFKAFNNIRNKFAHRLEYQMTDVDIDELKDKVNAISKDEVNFNNYFNDNINTLFDVGVDSIALLHNLPVNIDPKKHRVIKLTATAFALSNKGAFHIINKLDSLKKLNVS